jgi:hexosaminidase
LTLSGEDDSVFRARRAFGAAEIAENTEEVLYSPLGRVQTQRKKATTKKAWLNALTRTKGVKLPQDLEYMGSSLEVGLKSMDFKSEAHDYVELSDKFSSLWLSERKKEGLETVLTRLAGCAAVIEKGLVSKTK